MRRRTDGRYVISPDWDLRIDRVLGLVLAFVAGWLFAIYQTAHWN